MITDLLDNLKTLRKRVLPELVTKDGLAALLTDTFAHKFLMHLLTPDLERKKKFFLPQQVWSARIWRVGTAGI